MPQLKISDIDPLAIYTADDISSALHIHRTTVHRRIFPEVPTFRLGRKEVTLGEHLISHFRGTLTNSPN